MEPRSEQELTASIRLQRLNKLRKLHAQATHWSGFGKWSCILLVPLAVLLVPSGAGIEVVVAASLIAGLLFGAVLGFSQRVDAIVQVLEMSGAFTPDASDGARGRNEQAASGGAGQQWAAPAESRKEDGQ